VQRISLYAVGDFNPYTYVFIGAAFVIVVYLALTTIYTTGWVPVNTFLPPVGNFIRELAFGDCSLPQG